MKTDAGKYGLKKSSGPPPGAVLVLNVERRTVIDFIEYIAPP